MAPVGGEEAMSVVKGLITANNVVLFSKTFCAFCKKVKELLISLGIAFETLELDVVPNGKSVQEALFEMTGQKTVPNVFIQGKSVGGSSDVVKLHEEGKLVGMVNPAAAQFDYDLVVIGGGSGGLSASKEAAELGRRVAVCDFIKPSPAGATWGLGGTCVNVGCIPKKLMHQAALLGGAIKDSKSFGWEGVEGKHTWSSLVEAVQNHIGSLNWGYRVQLREKGIKYFNSYASFTGPNTVKAVNPRKPDKPDILTAQHFIIATGGRPRYLNIPGGEYTISSDDIFSLDRAPGKTLCVGASYISLECAGFLHGVGFDVSVMVRSILLRGFDRQIADLIGKNMEEEGVTFIRGAIPSKIEKIRDPSDDELGLYKVTARHNDGKETVIGEFNTILVAVGRDACTENIGLNELGVKLNPKNGKVVSDQEQTNVPNVYGIGDVLDGKPELTPVAIQAGKLLARRLYGGKTTQTDYVNVATTVFTPLEYGCIGLSEEDAADKYGLESLEVYHTYFTPLEWTLPVAADAEFDDVKGGRKSNSCYAKLVCLKPENERIIGFHLLGPNAGEITQGFSVAMKCGATKDDFDSTIGIHPTIAETFTTLNVTKSSGANAEKSGC